MKKCLRRKLLLEQVRGRGKQRRGRGNVRVLAAGLPRGSIRHENSQEDQIFFFLFFRSLFLPTFSWSLRSRHNVIVKMSHVAPETQRTRTEIFFFRHNDF